MALNPRNWEALSAMQKCIRRALEAEAGYWFFWLAENGWAVAALNRLKVTAYEDVGLGDPAAMLAAVRAIDDALAMLAAKKDSWRLCASVAVLALARAAKSREADHFQAVARGAVLREPDRAVPDFALDKHTLRGRRMGRGFDHFFEHGAKLVPEAHDKYEAEAIRLWKAGTFDAPKPDTGEAGLFE